MNLTNNPKIGIYDLNNSTSGLGLFYKIAEEKNIPLFNTYKLEYFEGCKQIIMHPPCIIFENRWKEIGEYIKKNPKQKFFFFAPNNTAQEIKKFIGTPKNVEYLTIENSNWDKLYSLIGGLN